MQLTEPLVQYRVAGLQRNPDGSIQVLNRIMAKVSREEVALHFLNPPPDKILNKLVARGIITDDQKTMALVTPMADDLISEANSGGHTDQRSAPVLLPLLISLRDKVCANTPNQKRVRVGAAGGLGTPNAIAGAFATGADFVLTGSVNQACIEAGTSSLVREMLSQAGAADVSMAPSSDMFEVGAKVQVLKRGTLFAMRASQLYDLYRTHDSLDEIPPETIQTLETQLFKMPIGDVWSECERFFGENDQSQLDRATTDPRHKMALIFRWYLGKSSKWATTGDKTRKMDAQIWCGPAIGSFNNWVTGSPLEAPENRDVVTVAANLMAGAAAITRARWLGYQGVNPGPDSSTWTPRKIAPISATPDEF
jgi:PfaD family protein